MKIKITALSPISHGAFKDSVDTGNISEFRRIPVMRNGAIVEIPTISGNAIRGSIRRVLSREYFKENKLLENLDEKEHDKLYAIMANGGALGKDLEVTVDPNKIREIREHIPIVSVLGSACFKYMLSGMCSIGFALLECKENGIGEISSEEMLTEIGETHHIEKTEFKSDELSMKPMPYLTEAIIPGAKFDGTITFSPQATEIEKSCIFHGIKLLNHIGGKSARGYGQIYIEADEELDDSKYIEIKDKADIEFLKKFLAGV